MMQVENPTYDIHQFIAGRFAYFLEGNARPAIGVVIAIKPPFIVIKHYEDGKPFVVRRTPQFGSVRTATNYEAITHLMGVRERLKASVPSDDLDAAVLSRRMHHLDGVIKEIEKLGDRRYSTHRDPPTPQTGVYVAVGIYSGLGEGNQKQGLLTEWTISEAEVAKILLERFPNGIGNIPGRIDVSIYSGRLTNYWVYGIPTIAVPLVKNPIKLESRLG